MVVVILDAAEQCKLLLWVHVRWRQTSSEKWARCNMVMHVFFGVIDWLDEEDYNGGGGGDLLLLTKYRVNTYLGQSCWWSTRISQEPWDSHLGACALTHASPGKCACNYEDYFPPLFTESQLKIVWKCLSDVQKGRVSIVRYFLFSATGAGLPSVGGGSLP